MRNFKDAVAPAGKANVRKIDGAEHEIAYPEGWVAGTALNRANMMALQGFDSVRTVFAEDGSITETYGDGSTKKTVFNADGSITETYAAGTQQMVKTTQFETDGSITEVVSG